MREGEPENRWDYTGFHAPDVRCRMRCVGLPLCTLRMELRRFERRRASPQLTSFHEPILSPDCVCENVLGVAMAEVGHGSDMRTVGNGRRRTWRDGMEDS